MSMVLSRVAFPMDGKSRGSKMPPYDLHRAAFLESSRNQNGRVQLNLVEQDPLCGLKR